MNEVFTPDMKTRYDRDGFLVASELFDELELRDVQEKTLQIVNHPDNVPEGVSVGKEGDTIADKSSAAAQNPSVRGAAFLVKHIDSFRTFATQPKLLQIVRGLIEPRVKVFRDQMLMKPPGGQAKPMHQDQSYFRVQPLDALVTAWVALDDSTRENGCMQYIPGSHTHGIFDIDSDPNSPVHHIPNTRDIQLSEPSTCPVPAGSVIFHHGCTLHTSDANRTETWRKAIIIHYATSDSRSENENLNEQVSLEID